MNNRSMNGINLTIYLFYKGNLYEGPLNFKW